MKKLQAIHNKKSRTILGLMSGTSCDGVDLALIKIKSNSAKFKLLHGYHKP